MRAVAYMYGSATSKAVEKPLGWAIASFGTLQLSSRSDLQKQCIDDQSMARIACATLIDSVPLVGE